MPLKSYLLATVALLALTFSACKKKGAIEPKPEEELLKVSLENVAEGQYTAAPGTTYTFQVKVNSVMPPEGVNIEVNAITDPGGIVFPQNPVAPSLDSTINITLTGLEPIRTVKVTILITSVSNPANKISKYFWITNKSDN
ncbi:MAG TPA: hypothetical protein VJ720_15590 [Chitinophaga sp.]|nr:hypothetical protein [Chitinophaga sp.]